MDSGSFLKMQKVILGVKGHHGYSGASFFCQVAFIFIKLSAIPTPGIYVDISFGFSSSSIGFAYFLLIVFTR